MRVRGRRLLPLLIALLVMAGAFCYGAVRTSGEIWSHLETGSVKIGIETLGLEHGTFRKLPQEVIVDCEKPVSYIPRITNRGETCYLRVRLLAKAGEKQLELTDHLQDIQSGWIRKGEYLYYQEPVAYGRSVDVCQGFQLPEEWDFYQEKNLQLRTEADALQAKNFKPDLAADNPWGDLVVTASQIEKGNLLKTVEPAGEELQEMEGSPCSITADQEKGLMLEEGAFFSHIMLLPGDSHRESLQLSNRETRRIQILMKAEWEKSSFLDQMQLQIDNGDGFYDGILTGADLRDYRPLATLDPGETRTVDVTLSFPESADNPYQQSSDDIRWCFAIKQESRGGFPVTGDTAFWVIFAAVCCQAVIAGVWCLRKRQCDE